MHIAISSAKFKRGCTPDGSSAPVGMLVAAAASPPHGKDSKNGVRGKSAAADGGVCAWDGARKFSGERCSPLTSCVKGVGKLFPSPRIKSSYAIVALQRETWLWLGAFAI